MSFGLFIKQQRLGLIALLSLNFTLLLALSSTKNERLDSKARFENIANASYLAPLEIWHARWRFCTNEQCEDLTGYPESLRLPASQEIASLLRQHQTKANQVILSQQIPESLKVYFSKQKPWINLVIPRSAHQGLSVQVANKHFPIHVGRGQSVQVTLAEKDLQPDNIIYLTYNIDGLPWFGPSQYPIALVDDQYSQSYADTSAVLETKSLISRDWQIALPLLIAALNLIINHARIFTWLSAYLIVFSIRSISAMAFDLEILTAHPELFLGMMHLISNALLLHFTLLMLGYSSKIVRYFAQSFLLLASGGLILLAVNAQIEARAMDLFFDGLAAMFAGLVFCGLFLPLQRYPLAEQMPFAKVRAGRIYWLSLGLLAVSLACLGWDNISKLMSLLAGFDKSPSDAAAVFHVILLSLAAFSRLGSTKHSIAMASKLHTRHALRLRERLAFRRFQQDLVSSSTQFSDQDIAWHCHSQAHDHVSGDWHEVKRLQDWVAMALFDVSGHDLRAAGHHLLIAAHWRATLSRAQQQIDRGSFSADQAQVLLKNYLQSLQQLFGYLPQSAGASGLVMFLNLQSGDLVYAAAGHHGFILESHQQRSWIPTPSNRLGADLAFNTHVDQLRLDPGGVVLVFTDGANQSESLSHFISDLIDPSTRQSLWSEYSNPKQYGGSTADDKTHLLLCFKPNQEPSAQSLVSLSS